MCIPVLSKEHCLDMRNRGDNLALKLNSVQLKVADGKGTLNIDAEDTISEKIQLDRLVRIPRGS